MMTADATSLPFKKKNCCRFTAKLNQWVLENDRSRIDQMFQQMLPNNQKRPD
ncbi:hypothetical protein QKW52_03485 [Bacillus sonorensis]|nr:hypothetical protein [Bacillus sonorensis]